MTFYFNLYELFVNQVFGGIVLAWAGLTIIMLLIGYFGRMSELSLISVLVIWSLTFWMFYASGIVVAIIFALAFAWFFSNMIMFLINRWG